VNYEMVIAAGAAALVSIIGALCYNVRRLRCSKIECCGINCQREVMTSDDLKADVSI
jgi:hypothetical protein